MTHWRERGRPQADFDDEIRSHIELEADRLRAEGVPEDEAYDLARRRFGNVTRSQERYFESRRIAWLDAFATDLRYAWRQLRRAPGFAAVVVITLSLGIGANAIVFGIVDKLLLQPPPGLGDPDRIIRLYADAEQPFEGGRKVTRITVPYGMITALEEGTPSMDVAGHYYRSGSLGRGEEARQVRLGVVSGNYFDVLGVRPQIGRAFSPQEADPAGGERVAVVSHGLWQRELGGAANVLGQRILVDDNELTLIGVAPRGFSGTEMENVDLWVPAAAVAAAGFGPGWATDANAYWIRPIARLRPGASEAQAAAEATLAYRRKIREWELPWIDSMTTVLTGSVIASRGPLGAPAESRVSLWLVGVSAIVLLVACANVANLLLARALVRRREIAVRLAIGVGRARLVRQLLTETALLALIAAAASLVVAHWGGQLVRGVLLPDVPWGDSPLDPRVLAFTAVAALLTVLIAGLAPALQASRADVAGALKQGAREGGGRRARARNALLVTQAAFSVVLLVGAGLFVRSLERARNTDVGIDRDRVLLVRASSSGPLADRDVRRQIYAEAAARARSLPMVEAVTVPVASAPMGSANAMSVRIPGRDSLPRLPNGGPYFTGLDENYFHTLGARVVHGRNVSEQEVLSGARVALLNESVVREWWGGTPPLGECLMLGDDPACTYVVGVVQDVLQFRMIGDERGFVYVPATHPMAADYAPSRILVRVRGDIAAAATALRRDLQSLRADLPYVNVQSYAELVAPELRPWRLGATMFTVFGLLALLIAAIGLYGVLAYAVSQRTNEIGVRMALGAQRERVVRLIVRDGVRLTVVGFGVGGVLALLLAPRVAGLLHETSPREPAVFVVVGVVLLVVAVVASVVPAWRASRVSPTVALRAE